MRSYFFLLVLVFCAWMGHIASAPGQTVPSQAAGREMSVERVSSDGPIDEFAELMGVANHPAWGYKKLAEAAEVIVVATLHESTDQPRADYRGGELAQYPPDAFVSVDSRFIVVGVLKGRGVQDQLSVAHLQWPPGVAVLSGIRLPKFHKQIRIPRLVGIEIDGQVPQLSGGSTAITQLVTPEYLLFLRPRDDGLYELASGQKYGADSVRMVSPGIP